MATAEYLVPWLNASGATGQRNSMLVASGDGTTRAFSFNFAGGYISKDDVKAYIFNPATGVTSTVTITATMWTSDSQITLASAVPSDQYIVIYRDTPKDTPLVNFVDGAILNEANLDEIAEQAVFVAAEMTDRFNLLNDGSTLAITNAAQALSTANTALATSNGATDTANAATQTATTANGKADDAVSTANAAASTANAIASTANSALEAAAAAVSTANNAAGTANSIAGTAQSALDKATSAVSTAGAASDTASAAKSAAASATSTANGIDAKATQALSAAQAAQQGSFGSGVTLSGGNAWVQDGNLTVGTASRANNANVLLQSATGYNRAIQAATGDKVRWTTYFGSNEAETGNNKGSNWIIQRFLDDGSWSGVNTVWIDRSTGQMSLETRPNWAVPGGYATPWDSGNLPAPVDTSTPAAKQAGRDALAIGGRVLLQTALFDGSPANSVTFLLPTGYDSFEFEWMDVSMSVSGQDLAFAVSTDNGVTFKTGGSDYYNQIVQASPGGNPAATAGGVQAYIPLGPVLDSLTSNTSGSGSMKLHRPRTVTGTNKVKTVIGRSTFWTSGSGASFYIREFATFIQATGVYSYNAFKLFTGAGQTISSGVAKLYGIK